MPSSKPTRSGPTRSRPSFKGSKVSVNTERGQQATHAAGDIAARFQVRSLLGEGGMGSVFVAHDRGLGRIVALKRLREGLESDQDAMRRFILEAQIGAQLEHPNIVPLYSYEHSEGGSPAITMQLLEGTTMTEYIEAASAAPPEARSMRGEYSLKERVGMLLGVCEAVHFAHERGVIHRDLKPDNVMLGQYREVYVMDWGLARIIGSPVDMAEHRHSRHGLAPSEPVSASARALIGSEATVHFGSHATVDFGAMDTMAPHSVEHSAKISSTATRQGEVMGTPQYMPPEQALGLIDQVGPAADQYSLAVMLLELAALRPARDHKNAQKALTEALQNQLVPPVDLDGRPLHPALAAIVARATQRNPEDRYPAVLALTDDLRRFMRDEPVSVFDEGTARQLVRAAARRPVLAMAIFSALGCLASALLVGGLVHDASKTARQARELENTRRAILAISSRAHSIDVELGRLAAGVEAIGAATVELLERDTKEFEHEPRPLPPLTPLETYGGAAVSFEAAVTIWPGKTPDARLPASAAKLRPLERWLRACVVEALPEWDRGGSVAAQNAALFHGRSDLLRAFVGLEDGTFTQFPARNVTADPRQRPWYVMAKRDPSLHWTRPMVDATRQTLRISAVMGLSAREQFLGVAGCDLRVTQLAKKLALELPGFRRAYLVTEDGKVAVSDTLEKSILEHTTNANDELDLPRLENQVLASRIVGPERGGYVVAGERLLVFSKLMSLPWTYVAELEKKLYIEK